MKTLFFNFLDWISDSIFVGIILILIGKSTIQWVRKNPQMTKESFSPHIRAWAAAIGFILMGAIVIVRKLFSFFQDMLK